MIIFLSHQKLTGGKTEKQEHQEKILSFLSLLKLRTPLHQHLPRAPSPRTSHPWASWLGSDLLPLDLSLRFSSPLTAASFHSAQTLPPGSEGPQPEKGTPVNGQRAEDHGSHPFLSEPKAQVVEWMSKANGKAPGPGGKEGRTVAGSWERHAEATGLCATSMFQHTSSFLHGQPSPARRC